MKWLWPVLIFSTAAWAETCPTFPSSDRYTLEQKFFTWGTDFRVLNRDGVKVAKVVERVLRFGTTFELLNARDELVASARKRVFSIGTKVDVFDCHGLLIGSVQKNILQSLFRITTTYSLLDANDLLIGQSGKIDWFSTDITLRDASNKPFADVHRPWVNIFGDTWTVRLHSGTADARTVLLIPAFKTSADAYRRSQD